MRKCDADSCGFTLNDGPLYSVKNNKGINVGWYCLSHYPAVGKLDPEFVKVTERINEAMRK